MAISLGDAVVTFRADLTDLNKSIGNATRAMKKDFGNLMGVAKDVGVAFTAMGGAIVGGLTGIVVSTANAADEIYDMSKKTGMSTEAVSKWAFALKQSGGDITTLQTAIRGMSNFIDGARQGQTAMVETLARLNMTVAEFNGLTPEQAFLKLGEAIAQIPDPMTRAAIAQDVFGKSGMAMLPVLSEGRAGLQGMFDEAERAGAVFSEAEAAMGDQFNDALGSLTAALQGAGKEIAITLIPTLIDMIGWIRDTVVAVKDWTQAHPQLTGFLVKLAAVIGVVMSVLGPILIMLPGVVAAFTAAGPVIAAVGGAFAAIISPIGLAVVAIGAVIAAAVALWYNWDRVVAFLEELWERMKEAIAQTLQQIGANIMRAMEYIVWAFSNPWDAVKQAWDAAKEYFRSWWETITGWFQAGWDFVANIVSQIGEAINWVGQQIGAGMAQEAGVPQFASGGKMRSSGLAIVGEQGPELVHLPAGARVYSNSESQRMMGGGGMTVQGPLVGNIQISGVNDPRAIAEQVGAMLERAIQNKLAKRGLRLQHA